MTVSRPDLRKPSPAMAAIAVLILVATLLVLVIWSRLEAIRPSATCLETWLFGGDASGACGTTISPWQERRAEWLLIIIRLVPILSGLGLGAIVGVSAFKRFPAWTRQRSSDSLVGRSRYPLDEGSLSDRARITRVPPDAARSRWQGGRST